MRDGFGASQTDRKSLFILLAVVLLITVPFAGKAVHLDDVTFINLARHQTAAPFSMWLPDFDFNFRHYPVFIDTHPPLFASYLGLWVWITGGVWVPGLHVAVVVFPLLASVSFYYLARRFTESPLVATLLMIATPAFVIMSQSLMSDVPAISLFLTAVSTFIYAIDKGDHRRLALSALFTVLAIATAYQNLSLVLLLPLYALLARKRNLSVLLPAICGILTFLLLVALLYARTGSPPKFSYITGLILDAGFLVQKLQSMIFVIGGAVVFPLMLVAGLLNEKKQYITFGLVLAAASVMLGFQMAAGDFSIPSGILAAAFFPCGLMALYVIGERTVTSARGWLAGREKGDRLFLGLWLAGVLVYCLVLLPYSSVRYLLQAVPPLVLLFMAISAGNRLLTVPWKKFIWAALILTLLTSLSLAAAEYRLADVYRDFGRDVAPLTDKESSTVWFSGEFGLRYYLEEQGARYLLEDDDSPAAGDTVIASRRVIANSFSEDLKRRLVLERQVEYRSSWPFRIQDIASQAGFYDQFHGSLPFSLSADPIEEIDIFRVTR